MKRYTFLDENGKIICQTKADNHDDAILNADTKYPLTKETDFYSEDY